MYRHWVLTALLVWPVVAAGVVLLAPERLAKHLALAATVIEFTLSLPVWWLFVPDGGFQFVQQAAWVPAWGISYAVGVDGISFFLVLLTTFLMPLSVLGSYTYITKKERGYYALLLTLTSGMIGVFVALDLFFFYVMWEVMLIPMYFIIGVWGGENRLYAAIKFFIYTMFGSLLMLVAILALYLTVGARTGTYSFSYAYVLSNAKDLGPAAWWYFAAFALAFAIKVPIFPFHTWLPDAHVEAPTAGSVILAGILLKMGTYGFLRFAIPLFPDVALAAAPFFMALAVIGIIYGAVVAMMQADIKKLVAYSFVSHIGFVMLGLFALNMQSIQGSIYQMLNHGLSTGALFLLVGMIYDRRHTRLIEDFGGLWKQLPIFSALLLFVTFSSIGLPGLNGFVGEFLILLGSFAVTPHWAAAAATGVILGAIYMLWMYRRVIFGPLNNPENQKLQDLNNREILILAPIVALIVLMGVYPQPFLSRMSASVDLTLKRVFAPQTAPVADKEATAEENEEDGR